MRPLEREEVSHKEIQREEHNKGPRLEGSSWWLGPSIQWRGRMQQGGRGK